MSEPVVDAVARFASREDLAEFNIDCNQANLVREVVVEQPPTFYKYLKTMHPNLLDSVENELNGMPTRVAKFVGDEQDSAVSGIQSDAEYAVHYSYADMPKNPQERRTALHTPSLWISTSAIKAAYRVTDTLFAAKVPSKETTKNHLVLSAATTAWLGLGKWAFDKINPRQKAELTEVQCVALLFDLQRRSIGDFQDYDNGTVEDQLDKILFALKCRFMGAMAYKAIREQIDNGTVGSMPDALELTLFQAFSMSSLLKRATTYEGRRSITAMELALANPFSESEAKIVANYFTNIETEGQVHSILEKQSKIH